MKKILIYGFGNPGRFDDGLGPVFVERIEEWARLNQIDCVDFEINYQLNIEDAELISAYNEVLFVDASVEDVDAFKLETITANNNIIEFSMHAVSPAYILNLCQKIFGKNPLVRVMHIKGHEWKFEEGLSPRALNNLQLALLYSIDWLKNSVENRVLLS